MLSQLLIIFLISKFTAGVPEALAESNDDILRSEIESAARESRALADDLAAMLARLEAEEDRQDAVEAAVVGDNEKVKGALKEMVDKVEELAKVSEESNVSKIAGLVKEERLKEDELKKTLEELEIVAIQIEEVASSVNSTEEIDAIEEAAIVLQGVSKKVEEKTDIVKSGNEKSTKSFVKRINENTALELNGIDEMIASLEKVTKDLRELGNQSESDIPEEDNVTVDDENEKNETNNEEAVNVLSIRRKPKQLNLDEEDPEVEEKENKSVTEKANKYEVRKPKQLEDEENCSEEDVKNRVDVCVPKVSSVDTPIKLYSGQIAEERHCIDVLVFLL